MRIATVASAVFGLALAASAQVPVLDGRLEPVYFTDAATFDFQGFVDEAQATLYGLDDPSVDPTFVWVGWVVSKNFNDLSYTTTHPAGGKHTSWPSGHSGVQPDPPGGDLEESDLQRLLLFNTCGEVVVDATMDLLEGPGQLTPSGYGVGMTIGESVQNSINGGDWSLFDYRTSLDSNLNNLGYCSAGSCSCGATPDLLSESPFFLDEPNYLPEAGCAYWEYDLIWELRIDRSVFVTAACPEGGQLPIAPDPIELHASPSKAGESPVALTRTRVSLGDFVWLDLDRDGVQDEGEPGIANVRLNLYTDIDGDGVIDPDLAVIDGYVDVDGDGVVNPDGDDDGSVYGVAIIDGLVDINGDGLVNGADDGLLFGLAIIDGRADVNFDGDVDLNDDGTLPGDHQIASTTTGIDGRYLFTQLGSGSYVVDLVEETLPPGLTATFGTGDTHSTNADVIDGFVDVDGDGSITTADDGFVDGVSVQNGLLDLDGDNVPGEINGDDSGQLNGVNVIDGRFDVDGDGDVDAADDGSLSALDRFDNTALRVFDGRVDLNRDGTVGAADDGTLDGVQVIDGELDIDGDGTITGADDGFFNGVTVIDGRLDEQGDGDVDNSDDGLVIFEDPEDVYLFADFGYAPTNPFEAAIGDFVWSDADNDGVQDLGEPGIAGVTVRLLEDLDGDGVSDDLVATTTTTASGYYLFTGLTPGDYVVQVDDGAGTPLAGYAPSSGPQSTGSDTTAPITVAGGDVFLTADFGYFQAGLGTIENQVWLESDRDGVYEPATESGISGVNIDLYQDVLGNGFIESFDIIDGELDVDFDGTTGDGDDDGLAFGSIVFGSTTSRSAPVIDGRLDMNGDGTVDGTDDGTYNGITVIDGRLDVDGSTTIDAADDAVRDPIIASTVTDGVGQYTFVGLPLDDGDGDADYLVKVQDVDRTLGNFVKTPDGTPDTDNNSQPDPLDVALSAGSPTVTYADFGFFLPAGGPPDDPDGLLGDFVWFDLDGDDVQDAGELGIAGVTLELQVQKGNSFETIGFTVTDGAGGYQFPHLEVKNNDATFRVIVSASNFVTGGPLEGLTPTSVNQQDGVLSSSNNVDLTLDFGYWFGTVNTFDIGDFVWLDADRDGFQDPAEVGIEGVTLDLLDADGRLLATTTTDGGGGYLFANLPNGDYTVVVTDTAGVLTGYELTSGLDVIDVTLAGGDELDVDFGYAIGTATASIGDTVWLDVDPDGAGPLLPDGVQGPGEPGLGGVQVDLYADLDGDGVFEPGGDDGAPLASTVTTPDGQYLFENLAAGSYFVDVVEATLPAGLSTTFGTLEVIDGGADLNADGVVDGADDGAFQGIAVIDGGLDVDGNGVVDGADDGTLNGIAIVDGFLDVDGDGSTPPDADDDGTIFGLVPLSEGEEHRDADFGFTPSAGTGALGDFVWHDVDADGVQDPGEVGIAGVEIILLDDVDLDMDGFLDEIGRTTTGPDGFYLFTDLAPDTYLVEFDPATLPAGFNTTPTNTGVNTTYSVDLQAGDLLTYLDYGFVGGANGSIGNLVWLDENDNGVVDVGEQGIEGVTISLYQDVNENGAIDGVTIIDGELDADGSGTVDAADDGTWGGAYAILDGRLDMDGDGDTDLDDDGTLGGIAVIDGQLDVDGDGLVNGDAGDDGSLAEPILASTVTDSSGTYQFVGLPLDDGSGDGEFDYLVDVTDIDKVLPLLHQTFGAAATDDNGQVDPYPVALSAGTPSVEYADFGFAPATQNVVGSIGTVIWHDVDGDGLRDGIVIDGRLDLDGDGDVDADDDGTFNGVPVVDGRLDFDGDGNLGPVPDPDDDGIMAGFTVIDGLVDIDGDGVVGETNGDDDGLIGGEIGIEGVRLDLWLDDGDGVFEPFAGDNYLRTVFTDVNGEYEFTGLPAGTYHVDVNDVGDDGVPATGDEVLAGFVKTSGAAGLDNNSQADAYTVTLDAATPSNFTADFGYEADDCPTCFVLAIRGTTFEDVEVTLDGRDPNGVLDAMDGLVPMMEVFLFRVVGGTPQLIGTTFSDINGDYEFTNLPPGDYIVSVDPSGTSVAGFLQTTQTTTGGVQPVTLVDTDSEDNDFGFFDGGVSSTPVTLAYFRAEGGGGSFEFEWMTATETGNMAFNLYVWRDRDWRRVNERLIPSKAFDSIEPQSYGYQASGVEGERFLVEDIDAQGTSRFHGPFLANTEYGSREFLFERIDWPAIRTEHAARKQQRVRERVRRHGVGRGRGGYGAVQLLVEEDGLYRVSYEQLVAAGLDLAGAPKHEIALTNLDRPVPIHLHTTGNFGPGSWIEFYGESLETLYTRTNVYLLQVDRDRAARVELDRGPASPRAAVAPFYLETLTMERDLSYSPAAANGDPWFDTQIAAIGSPASADFEFVLDEHLAGAAPVELFASLWGFTSWPRSPDHHVVAEVNAVPLWDELFDGFNDHPVRFEVPDWALEQGTNTLRIVLPADTGVPFEAVNLDRFSVTYPRRFVARDGALRFTADARAFQVDGLASPEVVVYRLRDELVERVEQVRVSGLPGAYSVRFAGSSEPAGYLVTTIEALRVPGIEAVRPPVDIISGEAELLVISHPDFITDELAALAAARENQGLSVQIVDVEEIFYQFGFGIFEPEAIRAYIAFAAVEKGTRHVLLVGGDTRDYLDHLGQGAISFVPSLYAATGEIVRFAPADALYTDIDDDGIPDLGIGRFPVRTLEELQAIVTKTLEYDDLGHRRSLVLAADDYDFPSRFDFALASDQLATLVPADWQLRRAYLDDLGVATAREALLEEMNAGVALTSYMGHSGPTRWTFDGLFKAAEASSLTNAGRPTVVAQWGCWTTYYVSPSYDTLAHLLLLSPDRGAAAVLGATTLTEAHSERAIARQVFAGLFQPGTLIGDAVLEGKRRLAENGGRAAQDVLLGWTLLGDPTLKVSP